jgi:hypothetical protein
LGLTLDETRSAYFRAAPEKLREIYQKYVPYLTITKENSIEENPEFKKINEEIQHIKCENENLKLDKFENKAIKRLKKEFEKLRKAQKKKEKLKNVFSEIIAGEVSTLNQGEDWEEKYNHHLKRLKADPIYRKRFIEFEKPFLTEIFGEEYKEETAAFNKKEQEEHKKLTTAEDKLYGALVGTKTLADAL